MTERKTRWSTWLRIAGFVLAGAGAACSAEPEGTWSPTLTLADTGASKPTTAVDPRSNRVYVAWVEAESEEWNVYLAAVDAGREVLDPVPVNDVPGDATPHAQAPATVAVGPEGHVYVAWQTTTHVEGRRFPASDLRFARSTDGGRSFEPAITVNDDAGSVPASHTFHNLVVGPDGTVYASWIDSRRQERLRAEGTPESELPGPEIRVARSSDGGRSFGPSTVVDSGACPCCRVSLAAGPDGEIYIAWRKLFDGNVRDIVVTRSEDRARSFGAPVRVFEDGWALDACPHAGPSIAVDGRGRLHVAWYTGKEGAMGTYYARSNDGGMSFGDPTPLLVGSRMPLLQTALALDGSGSPWLAWEDPQEKGWGIRLLRLDGSDPGRGVRSELFPGIFPSLASAGSTTALTWLDGQAVRVRLRTPSK